MSEPIDPYRIPRVPLYGFLGVVLGYLVASVYLAVFVFPHEPVVDYGIGTTTYLTLWTGPIGGLRDLKSPLVAYFGVLGYIVGSGLLLWLVRKAFFSERPLTRFWSVVGALAWWFLSGAALFGHGYWVN